MVLKLNNTSLALRQDAAHSVLCKFTDVNSDTRRSVYHTDRPSLSLFTARCSRAGSSATADTSFVRGILEDRLLKQLNSSG